VLTALTRSYRSLEKPVGYQPAGFLFVVANISLIQFAVNGTFLDQTGDYFVDNHPFLYFRIVSVFAECPVPYRLKRRQNEEKHADSILFWEGRRL
jgi:hypothetical protein